MRLDVRCRLRLCPYPAGGEVVEAVVVVDVDRGANQVKVVWTPQLPVVIVDVTPPTSTITNSSSKISSLKPNALGFRLK